MTGKTEYNVELRSVTLGMYGVISEDGKKLTFKNMVGVGWMEWIAEEEAALEDDANAVLGPADHKNCSYMTGGKVLFYLMLN